MIRYDEKFYDQVYYDSGYATHLSILNTYVVDDVLMVHILDDGDCYTLVYSVDIVMNEVKFTLIHRVKGFVKTMDFLDGGDTMSRSHIIWLKRDFDQEVLGACKRMKELGNFNYYCYEVEECGGFYTAKTYLNKGESLVFKKLALMGCLELTIESIALKPHYQPLFTDEELQTCQERIDRYAHGLGGLQQRHFAYR